MLLSEMYAQQRADLQVLSYAVIGRGEFTNDQIKGNQNAIDATERLLGKGILTVSGRLYKLSESGMEMCRMSGLYKQNTTNPSDAAFRYVNHQSMQQAPAQRQPAQ